MIKFRRLAALAAAAALATLTALPANAAAAAPAARSAPSASWGCENVQGGLCGSQEDATLPLMLAAPINGAVPGARLKVKAASTGSTTSPGNPTEDWTGIPASNPPVTGAGLLEYDPAGKPSGLCLARSGLWVTLAECDPGSWAQQIVTIENPGQLPGYRMEFRGTSLVIAGPNHDVPYRVLVAIPVDGKAGQNWEFQG